MILCFYTAYLFRLPTITSATTIANYAHRIRSAWGKMGITLTDFDQSVLGDILKGAKRLLPRQPDKRPAFLLPNYCLPPTFERPLSATRLIMKALVTFGFLAMLRFSAYSKLGIQNLVIVAGDGQEFQISEDSATDLPELFHRRQAVGFYLPIRLKVSPSSTRLLLQTINDFYLLVSILPRPNPATTSS